MLPNDHTKTTIGDLAHAFYEEALRELGDETLAHEVSISLLDSYLRRRANAR